MSFEAFKIAVKLSLVNGMSAGIASISREFIGLNKHVAATNLGAAEFERRMSNIKKLTLIGGAMAGAGVGMLLSLKGPIEQAMQYERELAKLRQMGLGDQQIEEARKFSEATNIIGTSMQQRMKLFVEAQGSFRESGMTGSSALDAAKVMMPLLAKYEVASGLLGGDKKQAAEGAMRSLNKTVEIMGGLGNVNYATEIVNGVFKAVQSSGKMVDERQLKQFVAYAASAGNQLSTRTIFGGLEPIIGEFGGSTTGVGLRTAYTRTNGMLALPPRRLREEMRRLGMTDGTGRQQTKELATLQATDVIAYAQEIMRRYDAHGIHSRTDRERENAIIFGTNGSKVFNKIMSQMPVILESLKSYDRALGVDGLIGKEKDNPLMAAQKFKAALNDLGLIMGQTVLPLLTPMVSDLADMFKALKEHPTILKTLTYGFVALGAAMAIGGTITLAAGAVSALSLAIGVAGGGGLIGVLTGVLGPLGLFIGLLGAIGLIASQQAKGHEWHQSVGGGNSSVPTLSGGMSGAKRFHNRGAMYDQMAGAAGGGRGFVNPGMSGSGQPNVTVQIDGEDVRHRILNNTPATPGRGLQGLNPQHSPLSPGLTHAPGQ